MQSETHLALTDATMLAHALVAHIATEAGIRVLTIKGPVAEHYGLRPPRASADADVWVEPERWDEFAVLLESRGWHSRAGRDVPSLLPDHARTYINDGWPCDIDLHKAFTGFFADNTAVFDALWASHAALDAGHVQVTVPSRAGAAVIGLLHAMRSEWLPGRLAEKAQIERVISTELSAAERADFYRIAREGGALWVLREIIAEAGLGEAVADINESDQRRWDLYRTYLADGSSVGWWQQVLAAPWGQKLGLLGRALWVPRVDVPRNDPATIPSRRAAWRYQIDRWRRGRRAMAKYLLRNRRQG